jgi:hypothetical protein
MFPKIIFDKNRRIDFIKLIDYHPNEINKKDIRKIKQYRKNRLKNEVLCAYKNKLERESFLQFIKNAEKTIKRKNIFLKYKKRFLDEIKSKNN